MLLTRPHLVALHTAQYIVYWFREKLFVCAMCLLRASRLLRFNYCRSHAHTPLTGHPACRFGTDLHLVEKRSECPSPFARCMHKSCTIAGSPNEWNVKHNQHVGQCSLHFNNNQSNGHRLNSHHHHHKCHLASIDQHTKNQCVHTIATHAFPLCVELTTRVDNDDDGVHVDPTTTNKCALFVSHCAPRQGMAFKNPFKLIGWKS